METGDTAGQALHSIDDGTRSEAARIMGSSRSDRKTAAARQNQECAAEARRGKPLTEEHRQKLRASQAARWERIKAEQAESGSVADPEEKRGRGRPAKPVDPDAPKRGRGRPKKQSGAVNP